MLTAQSNIATAQPKQDCTLLNVTADLRPDTASFQP